jgi:hypothetical protein
VEAEERESPNANGEYGVKLSVNGLLITRVFDDTGPFPAEAIAFGYDGAGSPDPADGDGSTMGATSVIDDATIIIQMKGDFNNDGACTSADADAGSYGFVWMGGQAGAGNMRQRGSYLGDFSNDGGVTSADNPGFAIQQTASGLNCPCP